MAAFGWKAAVARKAKWWIAAGMTRKVCPVVYRLDDNVTAILAFSHPSAGKQLVKGSIEDGELAQHAAIRELREESGIDATGRLVDLGQTLVGKPAIPWHFFGVRIDSLPQRWDHRAEDDFGHLFSFFWHPLHIDLDEDWHFHHALGVIRRSLPL